MFTWLRPGPIYVKRHVRSKVDLLVNDAEIIEASPKFAHFRLNNGSETTVSLRGLAPHLQQIDGDSNNPNKMSVENTKTRDCARSDLLQSTTD